MASSREHEHFGLHWVKANLVQTINQARVALDDYAEQGADTARLRACLTSLHQLHGTLLMLQLRGLTLLADHLQQAAQQLLLGDVDDPTACRQMLMQGILEMPGHIDALRLPTEGGMEGDTERDTERDTATSVAHFVKLGGQAKVARMRGAYQSVLLSMLKGDDRTKAVETLSKIAAGLQKLTQGSPMQRQWQAFGEFAKSLSSKPGALEAGSVILLRRVDLAIKGLAGGGQTALMRPANLQLMQSLLDAAQAQPYESETVSGLGEAVETDRSPGTLAISAHLQPLRAARKGLEAVKSAIVDFVKAPWDVRHLHSVPETFGQICGALDIIPLPRATSLLVRTCGYIEEKLLIGHQPGRQELDHFADVISGIDYYLERLAEENALGLDDILQGAERSLTLLMSPQEVEHALDSVVPATTQGEDSDAEIQFEGTGPAPELVDIFVKEVGEALENLDEYLPQWAADMSVAEPLTEIRRAFHTLKGSGRIVQAVEIGEFAWGIENMLNRVIDGTVVANEQFHSVVVGARDLVPSLADAFERRRPGDLDTIENLIEQADILASGGALTPETDILDSESTHSAAALAFENTAEISTEAAAEPAASEPANENMSNLTDLDINEDLIEVFFEEAHEINKALETTILGWSGEMDNRRHLESILRCLHTLKGGARLCGLVHIGSMVHDFESMVIEVQNNQRPIDQHLLTTLRQRNDEVVQQLSLVRTALFGSGELATSKADETIALPSAPVVEKVERPTQEMVYVGANLLEELVNLAAENSILRARIEQEISDSTDVLDEMETTIERLGEQQLSRSLAQSAADLLDLKETLRYKARESATLLLQQARINTELQEGLMRTRIVPFNRLLPRLRKIVRQVAGELDKEVDFHVQNAEDQLDRKLLQRMVPPLEHLLRNAVDHGIEIPEVRRNLGKAASGRVDLRLSREGDDVVIEISDDGAGIAVESVRAKAIEKGMCTADSTLRDDEVMQFVLAAGFSTATSVTQISGRGVGLDVVHSEVKQLGGSIQISSKVGQGTRFVLRVPFTVSVNRALVVSVADDLYAIPVHSIEGVVQLNPDELQRLHDKENATFEYAGVAYQIRYLGQYLGSQYQGPQVGQPSAPLVLVRSGDHAVAIHVDSVQGSREIVVKSLGPQFAGVGGISGATTLEDGSVVVLLDVHALIRAQRQVGPGPVSRNFGPGRPRCVLVVDDSVTVRKVTSRLLQRQGMDVLVAKDGIEAVALLQERRPDVMLLDLEMPGMDGLEVARQVRHDDRLVSLPIVMTSSHTGDKHQEQASQLGVDKFLSKPFQEHELLATIDELVTRT